MVVVEATIVIAALDEEGVLVGFRVVSRVDKWVVGRAFESFFLKIYLIIPEYPVFCSRKSV